VDRFVQAAPMVLELPGRRMEIHLLGYPFCVGTHNPMLAAP